MPGLFKTVTDPKVVIASVLVATQEVLAQATNTTTAITNSTESTTSMMMTGNDTTATSHINHNDWMTFNSAVAVGAAVGLTVLTGVVCCLWKKVSNLAANAGNSPASPLLGGNQQNSV